eukprot:TRINITY_DN234_c0_g2_i3.p1 TRINITY_DN234_c0_g2~~TRINITY_DN234_c0_g2_i3.p1  ORF type:complete len:377 (-),score=-32.88 TRINITY_DN234_c0_g2_i3:471-1601(-)
MLYVLKLFSQEVRQICNIVHQVKICAICITYICAICIICIYAISNQNLVSLIAFYAVQAKLQAGIFTYSQKLASIIKTITTTGVKIKTNTNKQIIYKNQIINFLQQNYAMLIHILQSQQKIYFLLMHEKKNRTINDIDNYILFFSLLNFIYECYQKCNKNSSPQQMEHIYMIQKYPFNILFKKSFSSSTTSNNTYEKQLYIQNIATKIKNIIFLNYFLFVNYIPPCIQTKLLLCTRQIQKQIIQVEILMKRILYIKKKIQFYRFNMLKVMFTINTNCAIRTLVFHKFKVFYSLKLNNFRKNQYRYVDNYITGTKKPLVLDICLKECNVCRIFLSKYSKNGFLTQKQYQLYHKIIFLVKNKYISSFTGSRILVMESL